MAATPTMVTQSLPWPEKHRPRTLDDLVLPKRLSQQLKRIVYSSGQISGQTADQGSTSHGSFNTSHGSSNTSHLLLVGNPGLGKTSVAEALVRYWYPKAEDRQVMVLELNASHDRGIQAVRDRIVTFMYQACKARWPATSFRKKVLILDEADQLTMQAQASLRCPLEECATHTLVMFLGNYPQRFISAIQSRSARLAFVPLGLDLVKPCLQSIITKEAKFNNNSCHAAPLTALVHDDEFWTAFLDDCGAQADLRDTVKQLQMVVQVLLTQIEEKEQSSIHSSEHSSTWATLFHQHTWLHTRPTLDQMHGAIASLKNLKADSSASLPSCRAIDAWSKGAIGEAFPGQAWLERLFQWCTGHVDLFRDVQGLCRSVQACCSGHVDISTGAPSTAVLASTIYVVLGALK